MTDAELGRTVRDFMDTKREIACIDVRLQRAIETMKHVMTALSLTPPAMPHPKEITSEDIDIDILTSLTAKRIDLVFKQSQLRGNMRDMGIDLPT